MSDGPGVKEIGLGSLIVVVVAALVVAVAALGGTVLGGVAAPTFSAESDAPTDGPPAEYAPDAVIAEPIPAEGTVTIDRQFRAGDDPKKVIIERSDRVTQEQLRQLVTALVLSGHEIQFRRGGELMELLEDADAYVRVDPDTPLTREELGTVGNFTDQGGHVIVLAEPNRKRVDVDIFGASINEIRTDSTPLAAQYGLVFGNRYLYNTERNDGNFKNVLVRPTDAGAAEFDRSVLFTATRVSVRPNARDTAVIARALPSTNLSAGGAARSYPVAVRSGEFLAVGDTTFMLEGRHNVADNEEFVEYVVTFALRSDRPADATLQPEEEEENATATPDEEF